jgi:hypothetical protein
MLSPGSKKVDDVGRLRSVTLDKNVRTDRNAKMGGERLCVRLSPN